MTKQTLIIEDHPIVSQSYVHLINNSDPDIHCQSAPTATKGLAFLNKNPFDLIILDINLPDMSGIEFCRIAKSRLPAQKILVVTSIAQRYLVEKILNEANGIVFKTSDVEDLIEGIHQVLDGKEFYFGQGVKELLKKSAFQSAETPLVTKRESEILKMVINGYTNQEIADKLFISITTVITHRKNLLLKFNAKNTVSLVKTILSKGIIDIY
jgi:DNA-binding NarL/FixJ family response regulator